MICSSQERSIQTNYNKYVDKYIGKTDQVSLIKYIDKTAESPLCRMHGTRNETISHIVGKCGKLPQKEYKRRHGSVGKYVHWQFCEKLEFNRARLWYEHEPESVVENENFKILWDFTIQCDHMIEVRRPNMVVVDKVKKDNNYRRGNTRRYKSM